MVELLEQMVSGGNYIQALSYADKLLLNHDNSPRELVAIHSAVANCRFHLNEFHGALMSFQLVVKLAEDLQEWDYHGAACVQLAVVLDHLGQTEQAKSACYEYLARVTFYNKAKEHHVNTWYNLGVFHTKSGANQEAIRAFKQGLSLAMYYGNLRQVHGLRHGLIQAYMINSEFGPIPKLLAQCLHYLRHNPDAHMRHDSLLFHYELRAEFALMTNRLTRALAVAKRGLRYASGYPVNQVELNMVCAKVLARLGDINGAIGHALTARLCAIQIRRFELESLAGEFMYELAKSDSSVFEKFVADGFVPRLEDLSRTREASI